MAERENSGDLGLVVCVFTRRQDHRARGQDWGGLRPEDQNWRRQQIEGDAGRLCGEAAAVWTWTDGVVGGLLCLQALQPLT